MWHRDIKPANILIDDAAGERVYKICDYGLSSIAV